MAVNQEVLRQLRAWTNIERSNKPIIGWRAWHWYVNEPAMLKSLGVNFDWEGPHVVAHVKPYDMAVPGDTTGTRSGVYSVRRQFLARVLHHYAAQAFGYGESWGRVAEFTKGWRAEHFMIRELFLYHPFALPPGETAQVLRVVENAYKCPVSFIKTNFMDKEAMTKIIDVIADARKVD